MWAPAITDYIEALKTASKCIPTEKIQQRIEAIRSAHPADYKRGSEQASLLPAQPTH